MERGQYPAANRNVAGTRYYSRTTPKWRDGCLADGARRVKFAEDFEIKRLGARMGGKGSGRHNGAKRGRVEGQGVALCVRDLKRQGALRPGVSGTFTLGSQPQPPGEVSFSTTRHDLELSYSVGAGAAEALVEHISLARVGAGFGGMRTYFECPGCAQRVERLYFWGERFRCRTCHGLACESQYEAPHDRAYRRADKMRAHLGYDESRAFRMALPVRTRAM